MPDNTTPSNTNGNGLAPSVIKLLGSLFRQGNDAANANVSSTQPADQPSITPYVLDSLTSNPKLKDVVAKSTLAYQFCNHVPEKAAHVWKILVTSVLASVLISKTDSPELHANITAFIQNKGIGTRNLQRHIKAESRLDAHNKARAQRSHDEDDEDNNTGNDLAGVLFEGETSSWQIFRDNHRTFFYTKEDNGDIRLYRLEFTPQSIQSLISKVNAEAALRKQATKISVFAPEINGTYASWELVGHVAGRPMETVILDRKVKKQIIDDIEGYRNGRSWWTQHGTPYRRGYLLHGPPGTGKTSFIRAVAFKDHLNIRQLTLTQKGMTDKVLQDLLRGLNSSDLVLIEDVDAAGDIVESRNTPDIIESVGEDDTSSDDNDDDFHSTSQGGWGQDESIEVDSEDVTPLAGWGHETEEELELQRQANRRSRQSAQQKLKPKKPKPKQQVTLKGILEAIDGVASPEGHLLIMSSNHPEVLDPALTRPGRIDQKVEFANATQEQLQELFIHFFSPTEGIKPTFDVEIVPVLASAFAEAVPESILSPAKIQEYLLQHRVRPEQAILNLSEWIFKETDILVTIDADILDQAEAALEAATREVEEPTVTSLLDGFQQAVSTMSISNHSSTVSLDVIDPTPMSDDESYEVETLYVAGDYKAPCPSMLDHLTNPNSYNYFW